MKATCYNCGAELPTGRQKYCSQECACGTHSGWQMHRRNGELPCEICKHAYAVYMREWRGKNRRRQDELAKAQYARNAALTKLAKKYPRAFASLYKAELKRRDLDGAP